MLTKPIYMDWKPDFRLLSVYWTMDLSMQCCCLMETLKDIKNNLDGWANWYPAEILGGPDAGREEVLRTLLADTKEALTEYMIN